MPIVDATFYLKSYYHADAPIYRIHKPDGRGDSPANPAFVPKGTSYVGAQVTIAAVNEWFYDENDMQNGNSHRYVDGLEIWVSSLETERVFGEDAGWPIYTYEGQHPDDYISVDTTDATGGQGPISNDITGNGLVVSVWIRCWQVWPWGEWSWEWRRIYRSEPLYLETAPYIYATSTPTNAAVTIDGNYVGQTPGIFVIQEKFENRDYPLVKVTLYKRKPYEKQVTLWWPGISEFDYGYAIVNGTLDYIGCTSPEGDHGSVACQGYNQIKCNAGVWEPHETDAPACGYPKPRAKLSASWRGGSAPLVVTFTDGSTNDPKAWVWSFGDGTGSTDQNPPPHTYAEAGTYTVTLEVSNQSGSDIASVTIDVTPAPVAAFEAHPSKGPIPLAVSFSNLSENTEIYEWDFGNGATSTDSNPSHTYRTPGEYVVTLTARNINNEQSVATATVTAIETEVLPPTAHLDPILIGLAAAVGIGAFAYLKRRPPK